MWRKECLRAEGKFPETRLVDRLANPDGKRARPEEHTVQPWQRRAAAYAYFGLIALLSVLIVHTELMRPDLQ